MLDIHVSEVKPSINIWNIFFKIILKRNLHVFFRRCNDSEADVTYYIKEFDNSEENINSDYTITPTISNIKEENQRQKSTEPIIEENFPKILHQPDTTPVYQFFSSLAARAETFDRRQQTVLEKQCLEAVHYVEFPKEDDSMLFFTNLARRSSVLSTTKQKQIKRMCMEAVRTIEMTSDEEDANY